MTVIRKEALEAQIATLERQLEAARNLLNALYGESHRPPVAIDDRYAGLDAWLGIRKLLGSKPERAAEYSSTFDELMAGGSEIGNTTSPRNTYSKSVNKALRLGHFLLNGASVKGQEGIAAKPGDLISLP